MSITFHEASELIETLQAELESVRSAGDAPRLKEIETAINDMTVLRAKILVAENHATAAEMAAIRADVEDVIEQIKDEATLVNIFKVVERIGIEVSNAVSGPSAEVTEQMAIEPPVASMDTPEVPPEGGPSHIVSARKTATRTVQFIDDEGREYLRIGGSRSWRNSNPGNIRKGSFSNAVGAIGDDGSFAIFPDKETGLKAIETLLRGSSYGNLSLQSAINRYAPPTENNTKGYVKFVVERTKIKPAQKLNDLSIDKIRLIVSAIEEMEGWKTGEERAHLPASGFDGGTPLLKAQAVGIGLGVSAAIGAASEWMEVAWREAALPVKERSEIPGSASNPRILEYFKVASAWFDPNNGDETDWCAAFVNYCLEDSGYVGTNHPGARSFFWNKKRQFIRLDEPRKFCIGVRRYAPFGDKDWKTGYGHVGFVTEYSSNHVTLLGGNQGNTIREKRFSRRVSNANGEIASEFVAFMMPVMT